MKHHGIKTKKSPDGINSKLNTMRVGVRTTTKKTKNLNSRNPSNLSAGR